MPILVQRKNERRISNLDDQIQQMLEKTFDFSRQKLLKNERLCQTERENSNVKSRKRVENKECISRQKWNQKRFAVNYTLKIDERWSLTNAEVWRTLKFDERWSLTDAEVSDERSEARTKLFEELERLSQVSCEKLMKQYKVSDVTSYCNQWCNRVMLMIECCY